MGPRFTSICGPGPAPGSQSLDASADFTSLTLDEISNHFKDNNDSFDQDEMSEAPPDFDWKPFISEEKLEKAIRKNQKKLEYSNRTLSTNSSFCSSVVSNTPNELKKPMTKIEWIMARKKLAARGGKILFFVFPRPFLISYLQKYCQNPKRVSLQFGTNAETFLNMLTVTKMTRTKHSGSRISKRSKFTTKDLLSCRLALILANSSKKLWKECLNLKSDLNKSFLICYVTPFRISLTMTRI